MTLRPIEPPLGADATERPSPEEIEKLWAWALRQPIPDYEGGTLRAFLLRPQGRHDGPGDGDAPAHLKDALEDRLHALVCTGKLPLAQAQTAIRSAWIAAFRQYVASPSTP